MVNIVNLESIRYQPLSKAGKEANFSYYMNKRSLAYDKCNYYRLAMNRLAFNYFLT